MSSKEAFRCTDEPRAKHIIAVRGALAIHDDEFCLEEEPCVILYKGCSSKNIVHVLVHETIHHALLWLEADDEEGTLLFDDRFDNICQEMADAGFKI